MAAYATPFYFLVARIWLAISMIVNPHHDPNRVRPRVDLGFALFAQLTSNVFGDTHKHLSSGVAPVALNDRTGMAATIVIRIAQSTISGNRLCFHLSLCVL